MAQRNPFVFARRQYEYRRRLEEFRWRQGELAAVAIMEMVVSAFVFQPVFLSVALLTIAIGTIEAKRMRATGRYWRTQRSMEIGL